MNQTLSLVVLSIALAASAHAQSIPSGVTESTDPAKAAAVEKAARELKARQEQDARSGKPKTSASIVRGKTDRGLAYLSGGVTVGDRVSMHAERAGYSLWVATVAKGSGAYLVDAQLRIVDLKSKAVVLERTMDGPWFFVTLPVGRYEVSATLKTDGSDKAQTLAARVNIAAMGQRQAVLRFVSTAEVSPEMQSPFKGNPFGKPPAAK
ncbi:MAG: hypothetical protein Q8L49_02485 [Burkholderiaceae bacterium]|nr:hypothetical protein [Burkholderiaceae bacterium]